MGSFPRASTGALAWKLFPTAKNPKSKPNLPWYSVLVASLLVQGKPGDEQQNLGPEESDNLFNGFPTGWVFIHPFLLILTSSIVSYKIQV